MRIPLLTKKREGKSYPLTQILISDRPGIPDALVETSDTAKKYLGTSGYMLFNNESLRSFICQHFGTEVVSAYDTLGPYAYRADLGRYCALFIRGGWYADIGIRVASSFMPSAKIQQILFREMMQWTGTGWACCNTIFFARPQQKFLQTAVEMVVQNVKKKYYGINPLCPTGPTLFGHAVAAHGATKGTLYGDSIPLTRGYARLNRAFVLPDGQILAFVKDAECGDLAKLGLKGGND